MLSFIKKIFGIGKKKEKKEFTYISPEEYLQMCGVSSSKELTDEQILTYFIKYNGVLRNLFSALTCKSNNLLRQKIDERTKAMTMLREAFDEDKVFELIFVEGEGVIDKENPSICAPHFEMSLREKYDYEKR